MKMLLPLVTGNPAPADIARVDQGLDAFNDQHLPGRIGPLCAFVRDADGAVIGGIVADHYPTDIYVRMVWVEERHRRQGHARRLLQAMEAEAQRLGIGRISLDTFDFQAPALYEALGYAPIGRIDDFYAGQGRTWFRKDLEQG